MEEFVSKNVSSRLYFVVLYKILIVFVVEFFDYIIHLYPIPKDRKVIDLENKGLRNIKSVKEFKTLLKSVEDNEGLGYTKSGLFSSLNPMRRKF